MFQEVKEIGSEDWAWEGSLGRVHSEAWDPDVKSWMDGEAIY